jgi:hypothetical protein
MTVGAIRAKVLRKPTDRFKFPHTYLTSEQAETSHRHVAEMCSRGHLAEPES